ncbi:MAG: serine/threonine protein kinase [Pirellulaceae bacterium]
MSTTLGRGGMGEVVRALDRRLDRGVAIKRLRSEYGNNQKAFRRFLTEAKSVAALNHYNIVQIYDFGQDSEGPFIVMELVEGQSLAERLDEGSLPLDQAIELTTQLCEGLQAAHDGGIVHRDIKPANILLTESGIPKLTDFGLARQETAAQSTHTQVGAVLGTLDFMPPEQRKDATQADGRSDQWSLAATFYQMVSGELPRVIDGSSIPESVREITLRALKTHPEERYDSIREFGQALQAANRPASVDDADPLALAEGQCAQCGASNDVSRQFCKGCGSSLQTPCPQCEQPEAIWERFCGSCGTDIRERLHEQLEAAQQLRGEVQALRTSYRHADAISLLTPLMESQHPALATQQEWATTTHDSLSKEYAKLTQQRDQLLDAAKEQMDRGRFTSAQKYISQIPEALRTSETQILSTDIDARSQEAATLGSQIQAAVKQRNHDGLEAKIARYLELKPNDATAKKLKIRLANRHARESENAADGAGASIDTESNTATTAATIGSSISSLKSRKVKSFLAIAAIGGIGLLALSMALSGPSDSEHGESDSTVTGRALSPRVSLGSVTVASKDGWTPLFNGTDLSGWKKLGVTSGWSVRNGEIVAEPVEQGRNGGWLMTEKDYSDFELELEFATAAGTDSGVAFRGDVTSSLGNSQAEIQIADEKDPELVSELTQSSHRRTGSLAGYSSTGNVPTLDRDAWHQLRLTVQGTQVTAVVNGVVTTSTSLNHHLAQAKTRNPRGFLQAGPIGLQKLKGVARFRNIRIRELAGKSPLTTSAGTAIPADAVSFGESKYDFSLVEMNWQEARLHCENRGGHLPIVTSLAEHQFLTKFLNEKAPDITGFEGIWLGATDGQQEGVWMWVDGSPLTFDVWQDHQPNNKGDNEHFALLWRGNSSTGKSGFWADQPKTSYQHTAYCVCEWDNVSDATLDTIGWRNLFNGRDLTGWRGNTSHWTVSDGELIGKTLGQLSRNQFLIFDEELGNFELQFQFMLEKGNSGVQLRSTDWGEQGVKGFQADIAYDDFVWMGCLGGEGIYYPRIAMTTETQQERLRQTIDQYGWNSMKITAIGDLVSITVNQVRTVDDSFSGIPTRGLIALQLHGGTPTEIHFRSIRLRDIQ